MPRLVRRRPLAERIKTYLNPLDFLLWLSEEFDSSDWEEWQRDWATPIGLGLNFIFLIARANNGPSTRRGDDVFGDDEGYSWWSWFVRALIPLQNLYRTSLTHCRQPLSSICSHFFPLRMRPIPSTAAVTTGSSRLL